MGVLLLGLAVVFLMVWFFYRRSQREDDAARQWQQRIMERIDEVFPDLERMVKEGIPVPAAAAESAAEAEDNARHQDDEDAARQREIEASNGGGEASRIAPNLFSGGGFVS
jgi:ribosomal protein L12E/L44/L45/RPP1/RPP2